MDDRRLLCLGEGFLGGAKSALRVGIDSGIEDEGEPPRLRLAGGFVRVGLVNGRVSGFSVACWGSPITSRGLDLLGRIRRLTDVYLSLTTRTASLNFPTNSAFFIEVPPGLSASSEGGGGEWKGFADAPGRILLRVVDPKRQMLSERLTSTPSLWFGSFFSIVPNPYQCSSSSGKPWRPSSLSPSLPRVHLRHIVTRAMSNRSPPMIPNAIAIPRST